MWYDFFVMRYYFSWPYANLAKICYIINRRKIDIYIASLFYAAGFSFPSVTVVVVDIVSAPVGSVVHAKDGNF